MRISVKKYAVVFVGGYALLFFVAPSEGAARHHQKRPVQHGAPVRPTPRPMPVAAPQRPAQPVQPKAPETVEQLTVEQLIDRQINLQQEQNELQQKIVQKDVQINDLLANPVEESRQQALTQEFEKLMGEKESLDKQLTVVGQQLQQVASQIQQALPVIKTEAPQAQEEPKGTEPKSEIGLTDASKLQKEIAVLEQKVAQKAMQIDNVLKTAGLLSEQELVKLMEEQTDLEKQLEKQKKQLATSTAQIMARAFESVQAKSPKIEKTDVDAIVEEYSKPVDWDGKIIESYIVQEKEVIKEIFTAKDIPAKPKEFANGRATVTQLGVLSQKRAPDDHNNYCGYYAAYNLKCLLRGNSNCLLNRDAFSKQFAEMLQIIKNSGHKMPYDNLEEEEIVGLLRSQGIADHEYVCLKLFFGAGGKNWYELTDVGRAYRQKEVEEVILQVQYANVNDFRQGKTQDLYIILNEHVLHWLTIKVHRTDAGMQFFVMDPLVEVDWTSDVVIKERLEPLFDFLSYYLLELLAH